MPEANIRLNPELHELYVNPLFASLDAFLAGEGRAEAEKCYKKFYTITIPATMSSTSSFGPASGLSPDPLTDASSSADVTSRPYNVFDKEQIMICTKDCYRFIYQSKRLIVFIETNKYFHIRSRRVRLYTNDKEYVIYPDAALAPVQVEHSFYTDRQYVKMLISPTLGYEVVTE